MNVKLRKDMMVVVLAEKTFIFNFVTLKLIEQVDTFPNPSGLCAISSAEKPISKIICLPAQERGSLKVLNYVVDKSIDLVIPAHDIAVGAIAVNPDGTLIASASERGHIIKIFSTDGGEVVQELKRGNSKAEISSIVFHPS
jgi:WD40 repeat protein